MLRWVLILVTFYVIKIVLNALQVAEVFTTVQLRQFWAVELEIVLSMTSEMLPPFYFLFLHVKNNSHC